MIFMMTRSCSGHVAAHPKYFDPTAAQPDITDRAIAIKRDSETFLQPQNQGIR